MLSVKDITVQFDQQSVLQQISLELNPGHSLVLLGPSGCGKTTLLNVISGMLRSQAGSVTLDQQSISKPTSNIAFILQTYGLLPWKTNLENVALGLKIKGVSKNKRRGIAKKLLNDLGLIDREADYPDMLSGGEKQRVAIARAYAMEPKLMLMDEPFSALDAITREKLQDTLLETWKKARVPYLLVTHSVEEAVFLGQEIVIMAGKPAKFVARFENPGFCQSEHRHSDQYYEMIKKIRISMEQYW